MIGYENIASYDIYIILNNIKYKICQPIGNQSILYAEQYALAVIPYILIKLKIDSYNRMLMMTDNLITFESVYKASNKLTFPTLIHRIRDIVKSKNAIIHKVKSHQKVDPIIGNNYADSFAKEVLYLNYKSQTPFTPWFSWENLTVACRDLRCYGLTDQRECWDILDPG